MAHGFWRVEDPHGRAWRHFRWHRWWGDPDGGGWTWSLGGEHVHLAAARWSRLSLKVSTTGEETLDVHFGLGPLLRHYWKVEVHRPVWGPCPEIARTDWLTELRDAQRYLPGPSTHDETCRRCAGTGQARMSRQVRLPGVRFTVDLGLTGIRWCVGHDPHSWERDASWATRLRRNDLKWWRVGWYRRDAETVSTVETEVPLPERAYPVTVALERSTWGMEVGPYRLTRRSKGWLRFWLPGFRKVLWHTDLASVEGLPMPGKGENSWDCGPDATFGIHAPVRKPYDSTDREWVATAISDAVESVLRDRVKYGSGIADTGR